MKYAIYLPVSKVFYAEIADNELTEFLAIAREALKLADFNLEATNHGTDGIQELWCYYPENDDDDSEEEDDDYSYKLLLDDCVLDLSWSEFPIDSTVIKIASVLLKSTDRSTVESKSMAKAAIAVWERRKKYEKLNPEKAHGDGWDFYLFSEAIYGNGEGDGFLFPDGTVLILEGGIMVEQ